MIINKDMKENDTESKVIVKCRGGGSLIDKPPIFTPHGLSIIVPWRNLLRCFSVVSGERITDYEGSDDYIVSAHFSTNNSKLLLACTIKGEILCWKWKTELLISKLKLNVDVDEVKEFIILPENEKLNKDQYEMLLVWMQNSEYNVGIFRSDSKNVNVKINMKVKDKNAKFDFGGTKHTKFIAMVERNKLVCVNIKSKKEQRWRIGGGRKFTCVQCPKDQLCIATGDTSGCIIIWYDLFGGSGPAKSIYHWHTLPVRCLTFSESGSELYSGANERVVVKWHLNNSNNKLFLPRLPGSVTHLTCGPDNMYVAIATDDNCIRLVDAQLQLKGVVQQLVKMETCRAGLKAIPSGTVTASSGALVINGKPGHLQFYSPKDQTLLYNLDVVAQNQITPERELDIPNTEVGKMAVSYDGSWLATFECLKSSVNSNKTYKYRELRLKFWLFDEKQRTFILNTSVELPHEESAVTGVAFQPLLSDGDLNRDTCCVTVGEDKRFRIWNITDTSNVYGKSIGWRCSHICQYRCLDCNSAHFSSDGSLLGVTFGPSLTLWRPDNCEMAASLTKPLANVTRDALKFVQFGSGDHCHLVVAATDHEMYVWSLLTLGMIWKVPVKLRLLCGDPKSEFMAAVTVNDTLFIFRPGSSSLVYSQRNVCGETGGNVTTLDIEFVPRATASESRNTLIWQRQSLFYLLTSRKELLSLEAESLELDEQTKIEFTTSRPLSAFAATLPGVTVNQVSKQATSDHHKFNIAANSLTFRQLLAPPVHTTAPMRTLCAAVLRSLILTSKPTPVKQQEVESDEDIEMNVDQTEASDDEVITRRRQRPEPIQKDVEEPTITPDLSDVLAESTSWMSILV